MTIQEAIDLANNGDIGAMISLGDYYLSDENRDIDESKKWYIMAAEKQVPRAAYSAALTSSIISNSSELTIKMPEFDPVMIEFILADWKDTYKWMNKTIEYKEAGAPNLEAADIEHLKEERKIAAQKCGVYSLFMDKNDEAVKWVEGLNSPWKDLVTGMALFQKATTDEEYTVSLPYLIKIVNNEEFLAISKNRLEEKALSLAAYYVGHSVQNGIIVAKTPNPNRAIEIMRKVENSLKNESEKERLRSKISECEEMKLRVSNTNVNANTNTNTSSSSSGGCYVATAVYGSYDCPQVWTLRRYRDNVLAETWYGRAFIKTYYAISPTLVKWFGDTEWFKKMWRGKLDKMVQELQDKGVECTPYRDINW